MDATPGGPVPSDDDRWLLLLACVLSLAAEGIDAIRQYVARSLGLAPPPDPVQPVTDAVIGELLAATAGAVRVGTVAMRPLGSLAAVAVRPPLVPPRFQPITWLRAMSRQGSDYRARAAPLRESIVPAISAAILDRIDLTGVIVERVEIGRIISEVDLDAVIERIDVAALARQIVDEIDLPEIIRESTGIVTSEAVVGLRMQGIQADERVSRVVNRMLQRNRGAATQAPAPTGAGDETAN